MAATITVLLAACSGSGRASSSGAANGNAPGGGYSKVLVIAEENEDFNKVFGGSDAPYLTSLSEQYGLATAMDAGYPANCPSLAAYIIMTSGDRHDICDDDAPDQHRITGPNIFEQVASSGREWRNYAESMPDPCTTSNDGAYLVRHAPAAYYVSEDSRCERGLVPLGSTDSGALHDDVTAGSLPAYGFVTPDACNDMHGGDGCQGDLVASGDEWLSHWLPQVMAGPDYKAGRLIIMITWDEGSEESNHIPALVVSPTTKHITVSRSLTQCNLLRTVQDVLKLAPLGCAATATPVTADFHL
jgi:hypothetical protein